MSKCASCFTIAYPAESTVIEGVTYHNKCLRCCVCKNHVFGSRIRVSRGKLFCPIHDPNAASASKIALSCSTEGISVTRLIFDKYDRDGSGSIGATELKYLCREMGEYISDEEATAAVRLLDTSGKGSIEYETFYKWWKSEDRFSKVHFEDDMLGYLNAAFLSFMGHDFDGNGTIDRKEFAYLHYTLRSSAYKVLTEQEDWDAMDTNKSGVITFNEYRDWLIASASRK